MAEKAKFDRGTALSLFKSDRAEDMMALIFALIIVGIVVAVIPK